MLIRKHEPESNLSVSPHTNTMSIMKENTCQFVVGHTVPVRSVIVLTNFWAFHKHTKHSLAGPFDHVALCHMPYHVLQELPYFTTV